ncbi:fimbrial protein, partial [Escherichia coli]|uniref:fimbrial protein n=1 Tax=Escherichia coli TaxID=562 RepID=UPI000A9DDE64
MKKKRTLFFISSLMLLGSGTTIAGDNLHFTGNLISKSCTPVINGSQLAEVHFPAIAASDLMNIGQSERVPLVFQLKDCHSSTLLNVRVTLTGTEDSALPGFLAFDSLNRPGFPGECFICELRLPDHRFRWKHNKLFLLLPEE